MSDRQHTAADALRAGLTVDFPQYVWTVEPGQVDRDDTRSDPAAAHRQPDVRARDQHADTIREPHPRPATPGPGDDDTGKQAA